MKQAKKNRTWPGKPQARAKAVKTLSSRVFELNEFVDNGMPKLAKKRCATAAKLWLVLWRHENANRGTVRVGVKRLANLLGTSQPAIRRMLQQLIGHGYLALRERGTAGKACKENCNTYQLYATPKATTTDGDRDHGGPLCTPVEGPPVAPDRDHHGRSTVSKDCHSGGAYGPTLASLGAALATGLRPAEETTSPPPPLAVDDIPPAMPDRWEVALLEAFSRSGCAGFNTLSVEAHAKPAGDFPGMSAVDASPWFLVDQQVDLSKGYEDYQPIVRLSPAGWHAVREYRERKAVV